MQGISAVSKLNFKLFFYDPNKSLCFPWRVKRWQLMCCHNVECDNRSVLVLYHKSQITWVAVRRVAQVVRTRGSLVYCRRTWACRHNRSPLVRSLVLSESPVPAESPRTGKEHTFGYIHLLQRHIPTTWKNIRLGELVKCWVNLKIKLQTSYQLK